MEVELIFDFRDGKKPQVYPLRYIEDFFPSRKLEEQLKIRFRSREGFCRPSPEQLHLNVVTTNTAAARLYEAVGFSVYGTDPRVLKIDQNYFDEYLMVLNLR